jgi:hypothetical protein
MHLWQDRLEKPTSTRGSFFSAFVQFLPVTLKWPPLRIGRNDAPAARAWPQSSPW